MGFLDRISTLMRRADSGSADPKGPLGLMPGDVISYYQERFRVTGIRILKDDSGQRFHYRLLAEDGALAVLGARSEDVDTWTLEKVTDQLDVDWSADSLTGPEGDSFALLTSGRGGVRQFGDTGFSTAQQVSFRLYADEDEEQMIVLEDYGVGREVRVADPIFEGQLHFESDVTAVENRPWAAAGDEEDNATGLEEDARVDRGSTVAAALALEGRFVSDAQPSETFSDTDPFEYADEEWADARDSIPEPQALQGSSDAPNDPRAEWLTPTLWAAGSSDAAPVEGKDDWLVRKG